MKTIYKFYVDCGCSGSLSGVFTAESYDMEMLISSGYEVCFGEVLGKHSDISGCIEETEITTVSSDPKDVEVFERLDLHTGHNPFDRIYEDEYLDYLKDTWGDSSILSEYLAKTNLF